MPWFYACVDVEASGSVPGFHDLVSIGAVAVLRAPDGSHAVAEPSFYAEIVPQGGRQDPKAMAVHGLTDAHLREHGVPLAKALADLDAWVARHRPSPQHVPVFVGHNAPFDWAYISYCYQSVSRPNPFGWKALDTKALAMGVLDLEWLSTDKETLAALLPGLGDQDAARVHRADYDAAYQARILIGLLDDPERRRRLRSG